MISETNSEDKSKKKRKAKKMTKKALKLMKGKYVPGTRRNKKRPDVCDVCRLTMTHKDELIHHLKKIHKVEYRCKQCGKLYKSAKNLTNHEKIHTAPKEFVCEICGYASYNRGTVATHRKRHTKAYSDFCDVCNKGFYTRYQLEEHRNLHTGERPFKCEFCEKGFICKGTLEKHKIASHSKFLENVKNFPCNVCMKTFLFKKNLVRHLRTHTGEKPFVCNYCGKGLASSHSLTVHKRTHTGEKPFVCDLCGKGYGHVKYLKDHMRAHGGQPQERARRPKQPRMETQSGETSREGMNLMSVAGPGTAARNERGDVTEVDGQMDWDRHLPSDVMDNRMIGVANDWTGRPGNAMTASIPGANFWQGPSARCPPRKPKRKANVSIASLLLDNLDSPAETFEEDFTGTGCAKGTRPRKRKEEKTTGKRVACERCGESLKPCHVEGHLRKHRTETEYPCDSCDKAFVCMLAYYRHGFRIHSKELVCDKCGKKFSKADYFIRHVKFGHAEKTYTCTYCSFGTPESNQLRMHVEKRHLKNYSLFCGVCSKGFFEKSSLKEHENTHTGATPYQCEVCGMSFKMKCTLRAHKFKFHPDLFPHACDVCGKGLSTKGGLDAHLKLHAENRKFMCDVCGRNLNTARSLLEHRRLHTGERPFECDLCLKSYPAQKHLVRHVKLIHTGERPEKNHECRHCNKKYASRSACVAHEKICLASAGGL